MTASVENQTYKLEIANKAEEPYLRVFEKQQKKAKEGLVITRAKEEQARERLGSLPDDASPLSRGALTRSLAMRQAAVRYLESNLEFMRPSSNEDRAYRLRVYEELPDAIHRAVPEGVPLRFHGTSLARTRNIFGSGELSSTDDREGYSTSPWGGPGMISVTKPYNVRHTVHDYTGLLDNDCVMPPGCIFVLTPGSTEEATSESEIINNVYFRDDPGRLVGVMTAPENITVVQEWAKAAGVAPSKVGEFFAVANSLAAQANPDATSTD